MSFRELKYLIVDPTLHGEPAIGVSLWAICVRGNRQGRRADAGSGLDSAYRRRYRDRALRQKANGSAQRYRERDGALHRLISPRAIAPDQRIGRAIMPQFRLACAG